MIDIVETQIAALNAANAAKALAIGAGIGKSSNKLRRHSRNLEQHRKEAGVYLYEALDAFRTNDRQWLELSLKRASRAIERVKEDSKAIKAALEAGNVS